MPCLYRGTNAVIKWSYHEAATLGPWTLTATDAGGEITATVVSSNDYRLSQPALTFCVPLQNRPDMKWPVRSLHVADGRLNAALGPQE